MIKLYLTSMFLMPFIDMFDRFVQRRWVHLTPESFMPDDKLIIWGSFGHVWFSGQVIHKSHRFLRIKIPFVKTWGCLRGHMPHPLHGWPQGWRTHYFWWIEGDWSKNEFWPKSNFSIDPPLEGDRWQ